MLPLPFSFIVRVYWGGGVVTDRFRGVTPPSIKERDVACIPLTKKKIVSPSSPGTEKL